MRSRTMFIFGISVHLDMVYFNVYSDYDDDNNNVHYLFLFKINVIFSGPMSITKCGFTAPRITYNVHIMHISTP